MNNYYIQISEHTEPDHYFSVRINNMRSAETAPERKEFKYFPDAIEYARGYDNALIEKPNGETEHTAPRHYTPAETVQIDEIRSGMRLEIHMLNGPHAGYEFYFDVRSKSIGEIFSTCGLIVYIRDLQRAEIRDRDAAQPYQLPADYTKQDVKKYFRSIGAPETWTEAATSHQLTYLLTLIWEKQSYTKWADIPSEFKTLDI